MAEFFEEFGKKVTDVATEIGKKAEETLEIQKLKMETRSLKRGNDRDFKDIGIAVYEKFQKGEIPDMDLIGFCESIERRNEEIEEKEEKISRIKEVY